MAVGGTGSWGSVPSTVVTVDRLPSARPGDADQRGASGDVPCGAPRTPSFAAQEPRVARLAVPCSVPGGRASAGGAAGERSPGR